MAREPRIETPLLRAYLRDINANPPYAFQWPLWAPWVLFALLLLVAPEFFVVWVILAIASPHIVRNLRRPRNDFERRQDEAYRAVRRLKWIAADGRNGIAKRMPTEVLAALERATAAHQTARMRILSGHELESSARLERLEMCMLACIQIAAPTVRADEQPKRDWLAVTGNKTLIASVVDAIEAQQRRMEMEFAPDAERLAALRELESELGEIDRVRERF
jgi:hypothetical protein